MTMNKTDLVVKERPHPFKDLSAGGVLEEILFLLARLELDRKRIELKLKRERDSQITLKANIERCALKRAIDLPKSVQREHDACIADITELNWHISFSTKTERKLIHNVELDEAEHEKLFQELNDIKITTPLIEEKVKAEQEAIRRIRMAQSDVDDLLKKARRRLEDTEEQSQVADTKAKRERETIEAELASSKRELNKARKRLQDAEEQFKSNVSSIETNNKKIIEFANMENQEKSKKMELRTKSDALQVQVNIYKNRLNDLRKLL